MSFTELTARDCFARTRTTRYGVSLHEMVLALNVGARMHHYHSHPRTPVSSFVLCRLKIRLKRLLDGFGEDLVNLRSLKVDSKFYFFFSILWHG